MARIAWLIGLLLLASVCRAKIVGNASPGGAPQQAGKDAPAAEPLRRPVLAEDPAKRSRWSLVADLAWNTDLGNLAVAASSGALALACLHVAYNAGYSLDGQKKRE